MPPAEPARGPLVLWSPPRCRSTAFLRMMHERGDHTVVHEPFSHLMDFGEADVQGEKHTDERGLMDALLALSGRGPVFVKDTTDFHYPGLLTAEDFLRTATHTVIVRHPREAIASHYRLNRGLTRDEIGFARVRAIYEAVQRAGGEPVVIDSDDLIDRPEETVRAYCAAVGIAFRREALSWSATVLPAWRRTMRWHSEVSASTGIGRTTTGTARPDEADVADVADHPLLGPFYRYHLPHYRWLQQRRLRVS